MSHQAISAGAHIDGIYHDSHALEGGEGGRGLINEWRIDLYNRVIVMRRGGSTYELYDLDSGNFLQTITPVLGAGEVVSELIYANFGNREVWVKYTKTGRPADTVTPFVFGGLVIANYGLFQCIEDYVTVAKLDYDTGVVTVFDSSLIPESETVFTSPIPGYEYVVGTFGTGDLPMVSGATRELIPACVFTLAHNQKLYFAKIVGSGTRSTNEDLSFYPVGTTIQILYALGMVHTYSVDCNSMAVTQAHNGGSVTVENTPTRLVPPTTIRRSYPRNLDSGVSYNTLTVYKESDSIIEGYPARFPYTKITSDFYVRVSTSIYGSAGVLVYSNIKTLAQTPAGAYYWKATEAGVNPIGIIGGSVKYYPSFQANGLQRNTYKTTTIVPMVDFQMTPETARQSYDSETTYFIDFLFNTYNWSNPFDLTTMTAISHTEFEDGSNVFDGIFEEKVYYTQTSFSGTMQHIRRFNVIDGSGNETVVSVTV